MIIEGVDPRDTEWEVDRPVYRVYFWHQPPAPPGVAHEHVMWHCDEYRLSEATDFEDVLGWARSKARPDRRSSSMWSSVTRSGADSCAYSEWTQTAPPRRPDLPLRGHARRGLRVRICVAAAKLEQQRRAQE